MGEDLAIRFLRRAGYYVWQRNCVVGGGEIDIIAIKDHTLVFVEVKTRKDAFKYDPLYAVDDAKVKQLNKLADTFIEEHEPYLKRIRIRSYRFDIIGITLKGKYLYRKESLIHCEDAFTDASLSHRPGATYQAPHQDGNTKE